MAGGYMGKLLFVDLTSGRITEEVLEEEVAHKYIGGYGIGAKILYERMKPGVDPLGPDNMLGFMTGPLTGTPALVGSRYTVMGKSALTGGWGDSNSGGFFGPGLKASGFDGVFFTGVASGPVYLFVDSGRAEIWDASDLWGKDSNETDDLLREKHGKKAQMAYIGPAGEHLTLISSVMNDKGRAAARSGLGAVMGAKKLKAIVVQGDRAVPLADRERASALHREYLKSMEGTWALDGARVYGTCSGVKELIWIGDAPVKNWAGTPTDFPGAERISDEAVIKYEKRKFACWHCVTACGGIGESLDGRFRFRDGHKPEYETLGAFGSLCLIDNAEAIWKANDLCNRAGMDTISSGAITAFAIECYENGILTKGDTDGLELTWGNAEAMVALVDKMARREGIGAVLADGVRLAAQRIGRGAEQYAVHVGGQEPGMHDPKFMPGLATAYRVDATPGNHMRGSAYLVESGSDEALAIMGVKRPVGGKYNYLNQGEMFKAFANVMHVLNLTGICKFQFDSLKPTYIADFMQAVTGWDDTLDDYLTAGERAAQIRHCFNLREGLNPLTTEIHPRIIGQPPLPDGPNKGITLDIDKLGEDFAHAMGWDPVTGIPSTEHLRAIGLDDLAASLCSA